MRTSLYIRLEGRKHRLLTEYARANEITMNGLVEGLVDQVLFQVSPSFEPPGWLLEAVESGALPIQRCNGEGDEDSTEDDEGGLGNVISLGR